MIIAYIDVFFSYRSNLTKGQVSYIPNILWFIVVSEEFKVASEDYDDLKDGLDLTTFGLKHNEDAQIEQEPIINGANW